MERPLAFLVSKDMFCPVKTIAARRVYLKPLKPFTIKFALTPKFREQQC